MNLCQVWGLTVLLVAASIAPVFSQMGVCRRTKYRKAVASQPATVVGYVTFKTYESYRCWLVARCRRRTGTGKRSVTQYRTAYRSQSYTELYCCEGYTGSAPNCNIVNCPIITNPANGNVYYSSKVYKSQAQYDCNTGHTLVGPSTRTCQANGHWSGPVPACTVVSCPIPTAPRDGGVTYHSVEYTSIATYDCESGFGLVGSETRSCGANGKWIGTQPSCEELLCPNLSPPAHGQVSVSQYSPGGVATFSCDNGYKMKGSRIRRCQNDETWTDSSPSCHAIQCSVLNNPANGEVSYEATTHNSKAVYSCDVGYNMIGGSKRTCQESQLWSGSAPTCEAILCSIPTRPRNGLVSYTSVQYGGVAHYSCFIGYKITGDISRTCDSNGAWTGSQPSCPRLRCAHLYPPANGGVRVSHYNPGGLATYSCDVGYRIEGPGAIRVCQLDETWSQIPPSCQQIFCPTLSPPLNGSVNVESLTVGSVASFSCLKTHNLVGSENVTCLQSGEWNGTYPLCEEKCVPFIGFAPPISIAMREGQTMSVCLSTCECSIESPLLIEVKARYAFGMPADEQPKDLQLLDTLNVTKDLVCFELTAVDDDLIEGDEYMILDLFAKDETYEICEDRPSMSVIITDNDELTIGFESENITVNEDQGTVEICIKVYYPKLTIPITDVVLTVENYFLHGADDTEDYSWGKVSLSISDNHRRACFSFEIIDDLEFEHTETFSIELERDSRQELSVPMILDPDQFTVTILDNDGVYVEFMSQEITIKEGDKSEVCIKATFSSDSSEKGFYIALDTKLLNADMSDFSEIPELMPERFSNERAKEMEQCIQVSAETENKGSAFENREEYFTIEMSVKDQDPDVMIEQKSVLIIIQNTDEPLPPCDEVPIFLPTPCNPCKYKRKCNKWVKKDDYALEVPRTICPGKKIYIEDCIMEEINNKKGCEDRLHQRSACKATPAEQMASDIGTGVTNSPNGDSPAQRKKRQTQPVHCYPEENPLPLSSAQCKVQEIPPSCPYRDKNIRSRSPSTVCTKRSVLLVIDSSYSIEQKTFRDIAKSLSLFVSQLCGDVQFGLLKFSSRAYLEFCFGCYEDDQPRDKIRERIRDMEYVGYGSFTGYAAKCAHEMMLGPECGNHDGRCIDVVFVTDGESDYREYIDVCSQVECLHRNPSISSMLKVYAINIGESGARDVQCITKHSQLKNGGSTVFQFDQFQELIGGLNRMSHKIKEEKHKQRMSGKIPDLTCFDWFEGRGFYEE